MVEIKRLLDEVNKIIQVTPEGNRRNKLRDIRNDLLALLREIQDGKI